MQGSSSTVLITIVVNTVLICNATQCSFIFGDSFSSAGFDADGALPTLSQPFGNPSIEWEAETYALDGPNLPHDTSSTGPLWAHYLGLQYNSTPSLTYNFAVGGATIFNAFAKQVETVYRKHPSGPLAQRCTSGPAAPDQTIGPDSASLFAIWIGTNDILWCGPLLFPSHGRSMQRCLPGGFKHYAAILNALYDSGAKYFVLVNIPPLDRTPFILNAGQEAINRYREGVHLFNTSLLPSLIRGFQMSHPDVNITLFDFHALLYSILDQPQEFGFYDSTCIRGAKEARCVWIDPLHPSSEVHRYLAEGISAQLNATGLRS